MQSMRCNTMNEKQGLRFKADWQFGAVRMMIIQFISDWPWNFPVHAGSNTL